MIRSIQRHTQRQWNVYLSGEIHTDWREIIGKGVAERNLPVTLSGPNNSHPDSDDCGAIICGMEEERRNWDALGGRMNAIRTKTLLEDSDVVVCRFGDRYRQWNAAFEAGFASAKNKPLIVLHEPHLSHMLKEVNAGALAVVADGDPQRIVEILDYTITGALPSPRDGADFVPIADRLGKGNPTP
ncbi:hypothetical protein ScalyP_jg9964 [Parmales sp. scaly parma]|nr:hypothetical protein ScalyP_jg9964 [Parmales sp. scaly parma]